MKESNYVICVTTPSGQTLHYMGGKGKKLQQRLIHTIEALSKPEDKVVKPMGCEGTYIYEKGDLGKVTVVKAYPLLEFGDKPATPVTFKVIGKD